MLNQKLLKAIGIGIPVATAVVLFGIVGDVNTVLFNTGLKIGILAGFGNLAVAWLIWKNHI